MININQNEGLEIQEGIMSVIDSSVKKVFSHFDMNEDQDLTIYLTNDEEIAELNKTWMDKDGPTDVLSFPADEVDLDSGLKYIGDIIVSVDTAKAQAEANGHHIEQECALLVVHGTLHLLGFDHYTAEEKTEMWSHQSAILMDLGLKDIKITE